jgi:hypothetical protein
MRTLVFAAALAALHGCAHVDAGRAASPTGAAAAASPAVATPVAEAAEPQRLDFSATLADGLGVTIDNPYGDVRLRFGGFAHALEIHAVLQQPADAAPITVQPGVDSGRYRFAPRLPAGAIVSEGQRLDVVAFIPRGHAVTVRAEHGLIESHGVRGDIDLESVSGDIAIRGTQGRVQAQTGVGAIEASLNAAPKASRQRLATTTGNIVLAVDDRLDAALELATSGVFATEFSLDVEPLANQEPNKRARTTIGDDDAHISVESRRGEIRLLRRSAFKPLGGKPADEEYEDNDSD